MAAPVLWTFLRDNPGDAHMPQRYHCAGALFRVLGLDDPASENGLRRSVQRDHEGEDAWQEALLVLRSSIEERRQRDP